MELGYFDFINFSDIKKYKLFIVTGDEPLQYNNVIEKITAIFKESDFEIIRHDLSEQNYEVLYHEAESLSLFSFDKLVLFNFQKPPQKLLQKALVENIQKDSDNVYLLAFSNIKKQHISSKWFQTLAQNAIHIRIYQPNLISAIKILESELKDIPLNLSREAIQLLAQKTEGNLIAAKQIIKLLLHQKAYNFDEITIRPFLHEHTSFDVFDLSDAILMQQKSKALKILNTILNQSDKAPLILWTIKKELRILSQLKATQDMYSQKVFKDNNVWASKQKYYLSLANKVSDGLILSCLKKCLDIDLCIKGAKKGNISLKLYEIVFKLVYN